MTENVEVTQEDRDAAWTYANFGHLPDRQERERWFSGYYDNSPVGRPIQAFARHRIRHQPQEREAVSRYPSTHLGEQQRPLEDTFSGFQMLRDEAALKGSRHE